MKPGIASTLPANTDLPPEQFLDQFMDANLKVDAPAARLFREWAPNPFLQNVFLPAQSATNRGE